jgi:hypothetical protein
VTSRYLIGVTVVTGQARGDTEAAPQRLPAGAGGTMTRARDKLELPAAKLRALAARLPRSLLPSLAFR